MFVVWKVLQLSMMRRIIPADLQFIGTIEPVVTISLKNLARLIRNAPHGTVSIETVSQSMT
jgi:hypothetical protein